MAPRGSPPAAEPPRATLAARHPESRAWLTLYDEAKAAAGDARWANAVPTPSETPPFIDGVTITLDPRAATSLIGRLFRHSRTPPPDAENALALLHAGITEDEAALQKAAERARIAAPLGMAVATLAAMPLLQACRAAWSARISEAWIDAGCPVCGGWATLMEARGLERRLRHRCGRCGADWSAQPVRCGFCGASDHTRLTTLVSERTAERGRVEACGVCRGYVKTITTLTACPPTEVPLLDLETVHLDVAAIEHGFQRPVPAPRHVILDIASGTRSRFSAWLGRRS